MLSRHVRASPKSRLAQLIRPSQPVRHSTCLRNAGRCSMARRAALGLPLRGSTTCAHHVLGARPRPRLRRSRGRRSRRRVRDRRDGSLCASAAASTKPKAILQISGAASIAGLAKRLLRIRVGDRTRLRPAQRRRVRRSLWRSFRRDSHRRRIGCRERHSP